MNIGVIAHTARITQTERLADTVHADYVSVDDGTLGAELNHLKVWTWLSKRDSVWSVALEDDAIPVDGFREQIEQVLTAAPTPIVSLYLGRGRPLAGWQTLIGSATENANKTGAHWITTHSVLHAVGLAIQTDLIPSMLAWIQDPPVDDAMTRWAKNYQLTVGYCWPSLVEHEDGPTLITHPDGDPRPQGRTAWWTGTRPRWNNSTIAM